ncbi:hypothetical protein SEUCBS139899_000223 [Sporothrix eucalyptigena]|uniref:Uncharacterized protein n=1 Tax=Sporothrix eucalyptigena TaxID=1812306 RepID=A0ABP0BLT8_9PEZI
MGLPWRRIRPILLAGRNTANLTPRIRSSDCCKCAASSLAHTRSVFRHVGSRLSRRLVASNRLYSTATTEATAQSTVISWTSIAKEEAERRQKELEAKKNGRSVENSKHSTDVRVPTQGDILIESFTREPLVPRPPNLSVLVTPAVKYDNYRETNRSKVLHGKSIRRQARLEAIRQAQLMPLPDWRTVLQRLVVSVPRQDDLLGLGLTGTGTVLSALASSSSSSRSRLGNHAAASPLARLYAPDPLKQQVLRQLPPGASANEYHRHAMSFALPDNSPSVESLLHGVDETLWAVAGRTGCILRLYRRGSDKDNGAGQNQDEEKGYRPWLLTLSGTISSIYRAADEVTSFAKDALPVTIGTDVRLEDKFRRDPDAVSTNSNSTYKKDLPTSPKSEDSGDSSPAKCEATPMSTWGLVSSSYYLRDRRRRSDAVFSPHTIKVGAHQIPRPDENAPWTPISLERYVAALVNGRPPAHLAPKLYPQDITWSKKADNVIDAGVKGGAENGDPDSATDFNTPAGEVNPVRNNHDRTVVNLLLALFHEEAAKHALSMSAFKMALEFMCKHGETYRPEVRSLFERADMIQMPMDTETFNILLASQVKTQDLRNFGATLALMNRRAMKPDLTTWLLFMRLFESEEVKRHILRTMHASRRDLLDLPEALGSIAQELVEYDARRAVFQRKQEQQNTQNGPEAQLMQDQAASIFIDEFIGRQTERYGPGWLSRTAANRIVEVFGSHGLFTECLQLLSILRQQQVAQARKEYFRERQQQSQQQQQQLLDAQQLHIPATVKDTNTIDTITYNIVLTHAKLHNSLPKAMAVVRHMEGTESPATNVFAVGGSSAEGLDVPEVVKPGPLISSPPPRPHVIASVAPDGTTFQMLFEMAHQRRLPHLLGALWAYASVTRKATHPMRKRAGMVLASEDPPNKTPLLRALRVGQTSGNQGGSTSPIPLGNAASERIALRYQGWEPAVSLSHVMQEAQNRDKMLFQDRLDRNGVSNAGRPLPSPLRIPLKRKPDAGRVAKKTSNDIEQNGVAYIEIQADWMLPLKVIAQPDAAEAASGAIISGGLKSAWFSRDGD